MIETNDNYIMDESLFSIGEIANLFNLNEQTLRYYDKIGLLKPYKVEENGYRKYKHDQIYTLATIRYLRNLDYSIKDIREYLNMMDYESRIFNLNKQYNIFKEKILLMEDMMQAINRKVLFIEEKIKNTDINDIKIVENPKRNYIRLGKEKSLYLNNLFYKYITMIKYKYSKKTFYICIEDYEEFKANNLEIVKENTIYTLEKGKFLTGYHHGGYEEISKTAINIRNYGEKIGLKLEDYYINTNIIDQFVECSKDKYLTEIQIPIIE